jgi:5-methylcytosine-specific restriction endonuclease McrA
MKTPEEKADRRRRKRERRKYAAYGKRNARIRSRGLSGSYSEYLQSPRWALIRAAVMERDEGKCTICGEPANCVHHNNYATHTLEGLSITGAFALCHACHKFIEFDQEGNKTRLCDMRKRIYLLALLKGRKFVHPDRRNDERARAIQARLREQIAAMVE